MSTFAAAPPPPVVPVAPPTETSDPPLRSPGIWNGGGARSLADLANDAEVMKPVPWDLEPYTAPGRLTLLSAPPKAGKTTVIAHYAAAKSAGREFLGQALKRGKVLWVGPDEHIADQVRRFVGLGAEPSNVYIWCGKTPSIEQIAAEAARIGADVVVLDTLPRIAQIQDENDNAAWTRWSGQALPLIRQSKAAWVALHHHRKSGGTGGDAIRGGSAIFGFVDIALSLDAVPGQPTQRRLSVQGTRYENASDHLELRGSEYVVVGEPREGSFIDNARLARVRAALSKTPSGLVQEIVKRAGFPYTSVRRYLDTLAGRGEARREGNGGQSDPYRYFSTAPEGGGAEQRSGAPLESSLLHRSESIERSGGPELPGDSGKGARP
jgi:AAA domain-containing protein